jgi:hypothetical protein
LHWTGGDSHQENTDPEEEGNRGQIGDNEQEASDTIG